ncbi:LacI family DNA-binding transcriptional regulator [Parasphaerochaeta coccoides]|uniref:Transcriptional regulator, LacI family n=1 Tax=Parasphaerochaeta coccoides (strain ATCC BAA-1237 / DSM 17374 / SPN1) TaxID=760011 RepID=F4GLS5_PARC1|nr:LacI family DNA-binding transcriptional regulator [Parasphaerochaeta coccoides]AEC02469.1 transcriptional regulator, LacI family [Parasphaerochaeta coccoides DSM 17374]
MGIKEIAEKAGVSKATVSLALNNQKGVGQEKRAVIQQIAREMNYLAPCKRQGPLSNQGKVIMFSQIKKHGLILNKDQNIFIMDYITAINRAVEEHGYSFELRLHPHTSIQAFVGEVNERYPTGLIILGTELDESDILALEGIQVPYLILDTNFDSIGADFITMANIEAVFQIVRHLKDTGHTDIRMARSREATGNILLREQGFQSALKHFGLRQDSRSVFSISPGFDGAYQDMLSYITQSVGNLPQAIFCFNDVAAFGVIKALKESGINVPQDISIVGFDNLPMASMMDPSLTTIKVPTKEIGRLAARFIMDRIKMKTPAEKCCFMLRGTLITRQSVKNRNKNDKTEVSL